MEEGKIIHVRKIKKQVPVEEYLKLQKRFRHLFRGAEREKEIAAIQALADRNIEEFGLLGKPQTSLSS
jgi:pyruvate ferredoxin oxidoreductase beta subunit